MDPQSNGQPLVTEVRLQLTQEPPILAFASVTLWNAFVVHDLRLMERRDGSRVVLMPRQQGPDGTWVPAAHPIREDVRREIEARVCAAYDDLQAGEGRSAATA